MAISALINTAGSVIDTKVMNHDEPAGAFYWGYQCAGAITGDNEVTFSMTGYCSVTSFCWTPRDYVRHESSVYHGVDQLLPA
ncbi:hypothetical protein [Corynebacterium diphtheriae]|uniref:hypothetical protein n=1 Tax=Corynebacterium diphtheriae TaxID=1717 RepID=UPI0013050883|nr:hypothetical protein [Corynebacterium diphtheriae]CAB0730678.1 hypothetical protein FRC0088_01581 [Corynebacterium diphtheriae]